MVDSTDSTKPDKESLFREKFTERMASVIEGFPPEIRKALTQQMQEQIIEAATRQFTTPGDKSFAQLLLNISVGARERVDLTDAAVKANMDYYKEPKVEKSIRQGVMDVGGTRQQADLVIATAQGSEAAIKAARQAIQNSELNIVSHQDNEVSTPQIPNAKQKGKYQDPPR